MTDLDRWMSARDYVNSFEGEHADSERAVPHANMLADEVGLLLVHRVWNVSPLRMNRWEAGLELDNI